MFNLHQTRKAQKDASVVKNEEWQKLKSMEMDDWLSFINDDDELGLTEVKIKPKVPTADEHLVAKFQEINDFHKANSRLPENNMANLKYTSSRKPLPPLMSQSERMSSITCWVHLSL